MGMVWGKCYCMSLTKPRHRGSRVCCELSVLVGVIAFVFAGPILVFATVVLAGIVMVSVWCY